MSLEEKETRVLAIALALALTLALFQYPERTNIAQPYGILFYTKPYGATKEKVRGCIFVAHLLKHRRIKEELQSITKRNQVGYYAKINRVLSTFLHSEEEPNYYQEKI